MMINKLCFLAHTSIISFYNTTMCILYFDLAWANSFTLFAQFYYFSCQKCNCLLCENKFDMDVEAHQRVLFKMCQRWGFLKPIIAFSWDTSYVFSSDVPFLIAYFLHYILYTIIWFLYTMYTICHCTLKISWILLITKDTNWNKFFLLSWK